MHSKQGSSRASPHIAYCGKTESIAFSARGRRTAIPNARRPAGNSGRHGMKVQRRGGAFNDPQATCRTSSLPAK